MEEAATGSSSQQPLTASMKATIALLVAWLIALAIEVPIGGYLIAQQQGAAAAIGPIAIEAIFVALIIVFIVYGRRGRRSSYAGALVVGIIHALLSALIYFGPDGPPLALGALLTGLPAVVSLAAATSLMTSKGPSERTGTRT